MMHRMGIGLSITDYFLFELLVVAMVAYFDIVHFAEDLELQAHLICDQK